MAFSPPERLTCPSCGKEFVRIRDETACAICSDPKGFAAFCKSLDKEIRKRGVQQDRETKRKTQTIFEAEHD